MTDFRQILKSRQAVPGSRLARAVGKTAAGVDVLAFGGSSIATLDDFNERANYSDWIISTPTMDRDGDILLPSGCDLVEYQRNPVVLFEHKLDEYPIGLSRPISGGDLSIQIKSDRILARCYHHDKHLRAREVRDLVQAKILNAASVGFIPVQARKLGHSKGFREADKADGTTPRFEFSRWKMHEWSICVVGVNFETVQIDGIQRAMSRGKIKDEFLQKSLAPFAKLSKSTVRGGWETKTNKRERSMKVRKSSIVAMSFPKSKFTPSKAVEWTGKHGISTELANYQGIGAADDWTLALADFAGNVDTKSLANGVKLTVKAFGDDEDEDEMDFSDETSGDDDPVGGEEGADDEETVTDDTDDDNEMDADEPDEDNEADTESEVEGDPASPPPLGATTLVDMSRHFTGLQEYIATILPQIDRKELLPVLDKIHSDMAAALEEVKAKFEEEYPEHDFDELLNAGEDEMPPEDPPMEDTMPGDEDGLEDIPDEVQKSFRRGFAKRLNRSHRKAISDAAEFLDDMAGNEGVRKSFQGGCKHHATQLAGIAKSGGADKNDVEDDVEGEEMTKAVQEFESLMKDLRGVKKEVSPLLKAVAKK